MCRPTTCSRCGKTGWTGCGRHVDQVMAGVPRSERCPGHPKEQRAPSTAFLGRLLGRG